MAAVVPLSLILAAFPGFAAHRASVCMVRAVLEVITAGRAYLSRRMAKTVLWGMAISLPMT